jgi:uncharacterized protein YggT (Ycf19 family)
LIRAQLFVRLAESWTKGEIVEVFRSLQKVILGLSGGIDILLMLRVILKLFPATQSISLVKALFRLSDPLVRPFFSLFPTSSIKDEMTLEFATIFASFAYIFVGFVMYQVFGFLAQRVEKK